MILNKIMSFALAIAAIGSAHATGIGVRAGTTGIGGDIGWGVVPTLSARVGYSALNFNTDITTSDVKYDSKVKLSNLSGLLDWSPVGLFRVTAGIVAANNKVNLTGTPANSAFTINGTTYQSSDVGNLSGTVKAGNKMAPYLGIGYGNVAGAGVNFYFDIGVMFQGSPDVSLAANCGSALSASQCAQLQNDVAAERLRVQDELKKYRYYPVANIGITIGF